MKSVAMSKEVIDLCQLKSKLEKSRKYGHSYFIVLDNNLDFYFGVSNLVSLGLFIRNQYPDSRITRCGLIQAELNIIARGNND